MLSEDEYDIEDESMSGNESTASENEEDEDIDDGPSRSDLSQYEQKDNDFDRLVQSIRENAGKSSSGLAKDWDFRIDDHQQEAEFLADLRAASGIGAKRARKGRGRGPPLSQEVRVLIGEGNQAYVDNNIPEALRIMQEVIRIEPRAMSAWTVMAQCYEDQSQPEQALQLRIMAAHLRQDSEEWNRLAIQSRESGFVQQALYCYRKLCALDPTNVEALWDRAALAKEIGDYKTARISFLGILKKFPHDMTVLSEIRHILIELGDLETCANLYQEAYEHYCTMYPSGRSIDHASGAEISGGGFSLMEVLVLADLYNTLGNYDRAINIIRKGCRWLQGRAEQKYWDVCDDDREYDPPEESGVAPTRSEGEVQPGHHLLDVNARHRLTIARIKLGEIEEGKNHANIILSQDVLDYAALFTEIADAYFEREMYAEAKPIYELLGTDVSTSSIYILLQTATCLRMMNELKEAAQVYEHVIAADQTNNDAKMKLAEIYEILNEPRKALQLVYEVIDSRRRRNRNGASTEDQPGTSATQSSSLFAEDEPRAHSASAKSSGPQKKLTHAELLELEAEKEQEVVKGYKRVKDVWDAMLAGNEEAKREWMVEADKLTETYRETRNLFSTSKDVFRGMYPRTRRNKAHQEASEDRMMSRLQLELESGASGAQKALNLNSGIDIFRGVTFDEWLRMFIQYSFLLTQDGQYEYADEILRHILFSRPFQSRRRQDTLRMALLACAILARRHEVIVEQCRKLINVYQFNNEPLRILLATLSSGMRSTDAFIRSTLTKFMFREVKLSDVAVRHPEDLRYVKVHKRYSTTAKVHARDEGDDADEPSDQEVHEPAGEDHGPIRIPTKHNPFVITVYGFMCIAAKSYQSAIFYLLHAYDYCSEDPVICLALSIASIGRAMQRQADNRHYLITQGLGFLSEYRRMRGSAPTDLMEINFNFGRTFHQLGLLSHAVKHYERVLSIAEHEEKRPCVKETAYNLSLIYVTTGAAPLAQALYRKWLSI
ncbi:TPR-like protein [Fistulina hepatica ATCC 64428]|uniref:TPR-like protein n=1 Tax=Fistulina hepatica ATCC 64428 TaxID=1128425 RepID=A0A0D7ABS9_9AGAR|nr:TPR-like protein [Fistulina hepatica ATCC 64428]